MQSFAKKVGGSALLEPGSPTFFRFFMYNYAIMDIA